MIHRFLLFSLLAVASSAADLKLVNQVQPDYSDVGLAYLVDFAEVRMLVAGDGVPFSLESSVGLPDNVVRALAAWRYQRFASSDKGAMVAFAMPIRRALSPALASSLLTPWHPAAETAEAIKRAESLDGAQAAALQAKLPPAEEPDLARTTLIVYYAKHPSAAANQQRAALALWLIEHYPQADILGSSYAELNPSTDADAAQKSRSLWNDAIAQYPADYAVTEHAVNFLRLSDPSVAINLLSKFPRAHRVLAAMGAVNGWSALGVNAVDPLNGHATSSSGLLPSASETILKSANTEYVLAAVDAFTRGGRFLAKTNELPEGYPAACEMLMAHAKQLYADTPVSCDNGKAPEASLLRRLPEGNAVVEAHIIRRVEPAYPAEAKHRRISGTEEFSAEVGTDGNIHELDLIKGVLALYGAARDAVLQWKFRPALLEGKPVSLETTIEVNFEFGG